MSSTPQSAGQPNDVAAVASAWLARRDRGLTAREQDDYLEWLRADPAHAQAVAHLEKTWEALDALAEWRPAHSTRPNPDLLAQPRRRGWGRVVRFSLVAGALAAAAAVAVNFHVATPERGEPAGSRSVRVIPPPERLTLPDGSVVELNHDGKIEVDFTPETRRVRLVRGEAHFTVTKNPVRPFFVEASGVAVRAVGTAFDVRHATGAVEVLVTEGKVQVERTPVKPAGAAPASPLATAATPAGPAPAPTPLVAGERAIVDTTAPLAKPVVATLDENDLAKALEWQGVRLKFEDIPLAEVVAEFNLRNRRQLVIGDAATGRLRVGGTFRADNVDAFVRLLKVSFHVIVERGPDDSLVLLKRE
jgi:transmembrane sensor